MRRSGLCLLALAVFCSGQTCDGPAPVQFPTAEELGSPIPEGIYTGTLVATYTVSEDLPAPPDVTYPATDGFGPNGLPLTTANESIYVGYADSMDLGGHTLTLTVHSINTTSTGLTVDYDAVWMLRANGEELPLTGTCSETFILRDDSTVDYRGGMLLGATVGTDFMWMRADISGQLAK